MLIDAAELPPRAALDTDVVVAGTGPAGIVTALELARRGVDVVLLEAGGESIAADAERFYGGTCDGWGDSYLWTARQRLLGGTSNLWSGYLRPLDALDLAPRPWVPDSGWPLDRDELEPYYRRASGWFGLRDAVDPGAPHPLTDERGDLPVATMPFGLRPVRFGPAFRAELQRAERLRLVLNAPVVGVRLAPAAQAVRALEVATPAGGRVEVRARHAVLACGAVENARLLLVSRDVQPRGIGNDHDVVGRYFLEHPVFVECAAAYRDERSLFACPPPAAGTEQDAVMFRLGPETQRRLGVLNCAWGLSADALHEIDGAALVETVVAGIDDGAGVASRDRPAGDARRAPLRFQTFHVRPEAPPLATNRVTLGTELDPFGNPFPHVVYRPGDLCLATVQATIDLMSRLAGIHGGGRFALAPDRAFYQPGYHMMGSTRMQDDPRRGVVDRHCRVHGVANLHVAGSSVFPAAGAANPTYTLVALAVRLADRLHGLLERA